MTATLDTKDVPEDLFLLETTVNKTKELTAFDKIEWKTDATKLDCLTPSVYDNDESGVLDDAVMNNSQCDNEYRAKCSLEERGAAAGLRCIVKADGLERRSTSAPSLSLVVFAIMSYSIMSVSVIYFNKWLFTSQFKYPVFVSWSQQVIGAGIFVTGSCLTGRMPLLKPVFPNTSLDHTVALKVLPLSAAFVVAVGLSNLCLQYTLITTYQVARSLTLIFVLILSYTFLKEKQTMVILGACGLIMLGFIINSLDPSTLTAAGLISGAVSSMFQALYNVFIKYLMPFVDGDNQKLFFYNLVLSSVLFIPLILVAEGLDCWTAAFTGRFPSAADSTTALTLGTRMVTLVEIWTGLLGSAVLGMLLNMSLYLLVAVTSPVTMIVVSISKALVQTSGGLIIFQERVTINSGVSFSLNLVGSVIYAVSKYRAGKQKKLETAKLATEEEHNNNDGH